MFIVYFDYLRTGGAWKQAPPRRYLTKWNSKTKKNERIENGRAEKRLYCLFSDCYICYTKKCTEYNTGERRVIVDESGLKQLRADPRIKIKRVIAK